MKQIILSALVILSIAGCNKNEPMKNDEMNKGVNSTTQT